MKIAYFPDAVALNGRDVLAAVVESAQAQGHEMIANSMSADAAIVWSVLWSGRMASNRTVYEHYRRQHLPIIVLEVGALIRGRTWKVAVNNVTARGYYGHHQDLDWDRPQRLGIKLGTEPLTDHSIVIAAQHSRSLQLSSLSSQEAWIMSQIEQLRKFTDRPIRVRPHPRCPLVLPVLPRGVTQERPVKVTGTYDSYDLRYNCHAMVNCNSGPGIQAAIAGVRPIVDQSSLAHPVGIDHSAIEDSYTTDRAQWLVEICHTEYTVEELRSGTWLSRIQAAL